jgi:hypothetical protein
MNSLFDFIIKPKETRYNNSKKVNGKTLILNTEISNHSYVSRNAIVLSVPSQGNHEIQVGDEIIVHHNVFRRFHDVYGKEKNGKSFFKEDMYFCSPDLIFMYKHKGSKWETVKGFTFVEPLLSNDIFSLDKEEPLKGIVVHLDHDLSDKSIKKGDIIGFTPSCEFEFLIDGKKLYRIPSDSIAIIYGNKGNKTTYNPGWARSG